MLIEPPSDYPTVDVRSIPIKPTSGDPTGDPRTMPNDKSSSNTRAHASSYPYYLKQGIQDSQVILQRIIMTSILHII